MRATDRRVRVASARARTRGDAFARRTSARGSGTELGTVPPGMGGGWGGRSLTARGNPTGGPGRYASELCGPAGPHLLSSWGTARDSHLVRRASRSAPSTSPSRSSRLSCVATSVEAVAQSSPEFSDLDETVHADAIRLVAEDGITRGYPDGTFRPREDVRRDQMATFLAAALRLEPQPADFPDVPSDSVHAGAIGAIADAGITRGFSDGTYRPREFVTRGQMATFLATGLGLPEGSATFSDVPSDYVHAAAIAALADADPPITQGFPDGTFRPNDLVKRDQMAAFLARGIPLPPRGARVPGLERRDGVLEQHHRRAAQRAIRGARRRRGTGCDRRHRPGQRGPRGVRVRGRARRSLR
jgi:hypothetical protein